MTISTKYLARARLRRVLPGLVFFASASVLTSSAWSQDLADYTLQPGDELEVSVWGEEELQRLVLLRPDGKFSFPFTNEIVGTGRTVSQVQAEMTEKLRAYIPEAVVTVSVTATEGNRIYVIGQVDTPGSFVMNPRLSVLQALSLAGGQTMRFVEPEPGGRTGVVGVDLWAVPGVYKKFDTMVICGVKWTLVDHR